MREVTSESWPIWEESNRSITLSRLALKIDVLGQLVFHYTFVDHPSKSNVYLVPFSPSNLPFCMYFRRSFLILIDSRAVKKSGFNSVTLYHRQILFFNLIFLPLLRIELRYFRSHLKSPLSKDETGRGSASSLPNKELLRLILNFFKIWRVLN